MAKVSATRICNLTQTNYESGDIYRRCKWELFGVCLSSEKCEKSGKPIDETHGNETLLVGPEIALLVKMLSITRYQNNQILQNQKNIQNRISKLEEKIK